MREKAEAQSQKIEDLQSQLGSAIADQDTLVKELKVAKSVAKITKVDANEMVAQYKADAKAAHDRLKDIIYYAKWAANRTRVASRLSSKSSRLVLMASSFDSSVAYRNLRLDSPTSTARAYSRAGLGNDAFSRSIAAFQSPEREGWFQGTADAIRRCLLVYTRGVSSDEFLVPRGYHLCLSDFQKLLKARQNNRADITVAV
nr:glucose-1-phosphate adenylyltransferase small subunit 1, chloroplastic/amyloplastic-like [Nicotiana tomentosiformis]